MTNPGGCVDSAHPSAGRSEPCTEAATTQLHDCRTHEPDYALALEEARRSFDALNVELPAVRARATQILGLAGLAASFLGGLALRPGQGMSAWSWTAVISFLATAVLTAVILWPRRLYASQEPAILVSWAEQGDVSCAEMTRDLALRYGEKYDFNRSVIDRLSRFYCVAAVTVCLQVLALVLDVWSGK